MKMQSPALSERDLPSRRKPLPTFRVADAFREAFALLGLISLDSVFAFEAGRTLAKANIGRFRQRLQLEATPDGAGRPVKVYLKRYDRPPILDQLRHWFLHHGRQSFAGTERSVAEELTAAGIAAPRVVAWGEQWGLLFERRSFLMTEEIQDSHSLESKLPPCFGGRPTAATRQARRDFLSHLASFIRRFHATGYRHRDLYLSHIFCSSAGELCLIDLARASRPVLRERFRVKDIAQLHYSAQATVFSRADRLRFYLAYAGRRRLLPQDKAFLRAVLRKTARMTRHNVKHGGVPPFLEGKRDV